MSLLNLPLMQMFVWLDKSEFSDAIASVSERNSEPRKGRYMVARGEAPQGARTPGIGHKNKCEPRQGWHNAWREIPHCFKIPLTQKNTRPPRLGAPLRYGPRPYLSPYAASLSLRRTGLNFLFLRSPGFHGSRLRCCAAPPRQVAVPPRAIIYRPFRGSTLGSLALANSDFTCF